MKKNLKLGALGLAATAAGLGGLTALGNHLYDVTMIPKKHDPSREKADDPIFLGRDWLENHPAVREVELDSVDGLTLHGWMLYAAPGNSHKWAVCVHGYGEDARSVGYIARVWVEKGWNVLLPDLRGHGKSEGSYVGYGWDDRLDMVAWCSLIIRRDPNAEIILHGVSMGGGVVLITSGGPLPKNVKAVVSDCAYSSALDAIGYTYRKRGNTKLGPVPLRLAALRVAAKRRAGYDLADASALKAVKRSVTPTIFIHGTADTVVPPTAMAQLYEQARCPKEFLWVPGAKHLKCSLVAPDLYWNKVEEFVNAALN